ncbi:MAG TPA: hypothetical protein PKZ07_16005 [Sedimentisphaerales bacterium]|nr:hypothetical protein [Sedimentisphaerales bacterium]
MPGPADDIKDAVKQVGLSDPMAQIGTVLEKAGAVVESGVGRARAMMRGLAEKTSQGTTRVSAPKDAAPKARPEPRKRLKRVVVDRSENGGFIAKHHYHPEYGGTPKAEVHTFGSPDDVHDHLRKTFNYGQDEE